MGVFNLTWPMKTLQIQRLLSDKRFQFNIANDNTTDTTVIKLQTYFVNVRAFSRLGERKSLAYSKHYTAK